VKRALAIAAWLLASSIQARERFPELTPNGMTPEQKVVEAIVTRPRKGLRGPFNTCLSDATFKAAIEKFGERGVVDLIGVTGYCRRCR
jgi:hypothetical protein